MQNFLDKFFFYDSIPGFLRTAGESFGFDTACLCSFPNFLNFTLHLVVAVFILAALGKVAAADRKFLIAVLIGVIFSGFSKMIDWTQNMFTATGETVFWSNNMDLAVEFFQLLGIGIILWALFVKLNQRYGRTTSTSTNL